MQNLMSLLEAVVDMKSGWMILLCIVILGLLFVAAAVELSLALVDRVRAARRRRAVLREMGPTPQLILIELAETNRYFDAKRAALQGKVPAANKTQLIQRGWLHMDPWGWYWEVMWGF